MRHSVARLAGAGEGARRYHSRRETTSLAPRTLLLLAALLVVAQFLPCGHVDHPPVTAEPQWDSPRTRELVARSCFDCHSNQSQRRWYHVAPASWLVAHDVKEAREHLNFSEWDREQRHADEAAEEVEEREMPLKKYLAVHPEARSKTQSEPR